MSPFQAHLKLDQRRDVALPCLDVVAQIQQLLLGVEALELRFQRTSLLVVVHTLVKERVHQNSLSRQ